MKKILPLALLAATLAFAACTKEESVAEKVSQKVDQINTEIADTAVEKLQTPINKVRAAQDHGPERLEAINQAVQNQTK